MRKHIKIKLKFWRNQNFIIPLHRYVWVNKGLGARRSSFFYFIPLPRQNTVEITKKETEAADFRFLFSSLGNWHPYPGACHHDWMILALIACSHVFCVSICCFTPGSFVRAVLNLAGEACILREGDGAI